MTIDDTGEHVKEVYARFGAAVYFANVLEHGIVNALMVLDLIPTRRHTVRSAAEWAALVDGFMDSHFETTMGKMLRSLRSVTTVPDALDQQLRDALRRRNWLAHAFFRERAEEFLSPQGRDQMIDEVDDCRSAFQVADRALEEIVAPLRRSAGITDEVLATALADMMARAKA